MGTAKVVGGSEIPFRSVLTEIPDRPVQRNYSLRKGHCERSISVEPRTGNYSRERTCRATAMPSVEVAGLHAAPFFGLRIPRGNDGWAAKICRGSVGLQSAAP